MNISMKKWSVMQHGPWSTFYTVLFLCDPQLYIHMKVEHTFVDMELACKILVLTMVFQVDVAVLAETIELAKIFSYGLLTHPLYRVK